MRSRQGRVLETLRRLQTFLNTNTDLLVSFNASTARRVLDEHIATFTTYSVDQDAGLVNSKGETGLYRALRRSLRDGHLKPIAIIARAHLRPVPEFTAFDLPPLRTTTERLVAAAGAMAEAATPHQDVFIGSGMPDDFVARLLGAADAVRNMVDQRATSQARRVGATQGLVSEEERGRNFIRVLDALVMPALGTQEHLVAEWKSLRRIDAKPGAPRRRSRSRKVPADTAATGMDDSATTPAALSAAPTSEGGAEEAAPVLPRETV